MALERAAKGGFRLITEGISEFGDRYVAFRQLPVPTTPVFPRPSRNRPATASYPFNLSGTRDLLVPNQRGYRLGKFEEF
jgi:hypothetical protein